MTLHLLETRKADFQALAALHTKAFEPAWSAEAIADLVANGSFIIIAGLDASPEGFVAARVAADEAEILTLVVASPLRRRGIGRSLVLTAARHAAHIGAKTMFLEVDVANIAARSLYEGLQFSMVGRRSGYYRNPAQNASDALTLRADLPLPSMGKIGESR